MRKATKHKLIAIGEAFIIVSLGLILFKFVPMSIFGSQIQFDASAHVSVIAKCLYALWFFVDQNRGWRVPYFVCSLAILTIIAIQRIIIEAHNEIGVTGGFAISATAIAYAQRKKLKNKIKF